MVRDIVHGLEGQIAVESTPMVGTTFSVFLRECEAVDLPAAPVDGVPARGEPHRVDPHSSGGRILVVEDESAVRELIELVLKNAGYEVHTAADGRRAIEQLQAMTFDLVVSDVVMPELGGIALLDALDDIGVDSPVLFVSGYDEADLPFEKLPTGHFLQKPFSPEDLLGRMNDLLARAPVERPFGL